MASVRSLPGASSSGLYRAAMDILRGCVEEQYLQHRLYRQKLSQPIMFSIYAVFGTPTASYLDIR
jgi:hypothetical protein